MSYIRKNSAEWNQKSVLFVHGIGDQSDGYSKELIEIIAKAQGGAELVAATRWFEVQYDFVNKTMLAKNQDAWNQLAKITPEKAADAPPEMSK